ncbi:hypothetical protein A3H77_01375 [Candidatus Kaiserbacteria bacterium RIFCSPLOWO2_02_FULL_56_11]|uniref:PD-(D/E)XK endonuclease-like domain-containing protein n=2 Tax=Candidatus Kaiseribacteriota TaxID=1752734 RepID=A0A1F6E3U6_9BACT|nr:MAG: hypothetical protein A3C95_01610 [Candidatus Kaiserbacteria bacterium RIFCSPHIGHO2_02_FULL_56_30]OGG72099.1 MAG: hypothetical protein A3E65_00705 [Candidatus Kaiserbacteria bacterium RIFCSPHIGHO2_12_FULL_56_13]OGG82324.1 MAG: hypothetical protein A3H77_01375 [Candidatus Kaiserbacteria bacterium RIFCSPLOWO2_02_FULL_56_11]
MAVRQKTFDGASKEPFKVSRSKIELFTQCPRCAYLDLKLGVKRPETPTFTLNNAVDALLKREFDTHRANGEAHPLMKTYGIDAIPYTHEKLDEWRENFKGIRYLHETTNLLVTGAIDDVWEDTVTGELFIVDYKATSKNKTITEDDLYDSYKQQMEIYQWLFRQNGFTVSPVGYFVSVNGKSDAKAFDARLEFDVAVIPYRGSDAWVEPTLFRIKETLESDAIPPIGRAFRGGPCDYCTYREAAGKTFRALTKHVKERK